MLLLVVAVYGSAFMESFRDWRNSPQDAQGLVIVPFAALVAWVRRQSVIATPPGSKLPGLILAGAACTLHVIGQLAAGLYVSQLSFIVFSAGVIWTFLGISRLRALTLPLLLMAIAIPLPSSLYASLSLPLQLLASKMACGIADLVGIAVYREGYMIHLASMSVGVWQACSGINSLSALVAGAVLLGFLLCRRLMTRILVCFAAVPVAVVANVTRVTGTALLSDWNPAYAMGFYHVFSSWFVFSVGATGLYIATISLRKFLEK